MFKKVMYGDLSTPIEALEMVMIQWKPEEEKNPYVEMIKKKIEEREARIMAEKAAEAAELKRLEEEIQSLEAEYSSLNAEEEAETESLKEDVEEEDDEEFIGMVKVNMAYSAESKDELSLKPGEVIGVLERSEDNWWVGQNYQGDVGIFPFSHCVEVNMTSPVTTSDKAS